MDRFGEAKPHFDAAIDLSTDPNLDKDIALTQGIEAGDYATAMIALRNPRPETPTVTRTALMSGYGALASGAPRIVADAALNRGDAIGELPDGWLDARIHAALERAKGAIG